MSDDLTDTNSRLHNRGITLPDGENATYNAELTPLFILRAGVISTPISDLANKEIGLSNVTWSSTTLSSEWSYYLYFGNIELRPSNYWWYTYGNSLRCLVSITNSYIIKRDGNLVSDKINYEQYWLSNMGATLPNHSNAIYNISLSPLFFGRIGEASIDSKTSAGRGLYVSLWSRTVYIKDRAYWATFGDQDIIPSQNNNRTLTFPLRCLVSTTNS